MAPPDRKVAVITGAGTGIGAATARRFLADGFACVLAGRRADKLAEIAAGHDPACVLAQPTDVTDPAACAALIAAAIARFGRLDVLVNNAGYAAFGSFLETPPTSGGARWRPTSTA